MVDVLISLIVLLAIAAVLLFMFNITESNNVQLYWCVGLILIILVDWSIIRELTIRQNYKIDKNMLFVDRLSTASNTRTLIFSKQIKVETTSFDMPLGEMLDYKNYRIYFDSLTYIDVNSVSFDSLDLKYGKKLYKE